MENSRESLLQPLQKHKFKQRVVVFGDTHNFFLYIFLRYQNDATNLPYT